MRPYMNMRPYRPRQRMLTKKKPRTKSCRFLSISPNRCRQLGLLMVAALGMGLGLTQFFHVRIVALQAKVDQLKTSSMAITEKNHNLLAANAQMTSKVQVAALAKRRLQLFEPGQGQVRRM